MGEAAEAGRPLVVGKTKVEPGQRVTIDLPIARLYTHTELTMPVQVVRGARDGPRLFVTAGVHGDELNGVEVVRRLLRHPGLEQLAGALIAVPMVNVFGFINHSRYLPDRRDLNRSFPGTEGGSLTGQLARLVTQEVAAPATHGIDLHTGSQHRSNLPQVRAKLDDPETLRLAKAFGAPVIVDANVRDGSLRQAVTERKKPMLLYEAGEALRFDDVAIRAGVRGVLNVMRALGMLPPEAAAADVPEQPAPVIARATLWSRAPASGILRDPVPLGARVRRRDVLATVGDLLGEVEVPVLSPASGIVIGRLNLPLVHKGDALFHVARFARNTSAFDTLEAFQAVMESDDALEPVGAGERAAPPAGALPGEAPAAPTSAPAPAPAQPVARAAEPGPAGARRGEAKP